MLALSLLAHHDGQHDPQRRAARRSAQELDASSSQLQWIVDSYLLVFAGLLLAAGSLGDRFGRKRALDGRADGVRRSGPSLAALATDAATLIAARAVMGLGAAGIMPTTLSILTNIFPADERPKAIAAWAAVAGLGIAIGPVAGGLLIEHFSWSSIFLINVPVVAPGPGRRGRRWCRTRATRQRRKLDLRGTGLSIAGLERDRLGPDRGAGARLGQPADRRAPSPPARRSSRRSSPGSATPTTRCSTSACSATCASARPASRSRSCSSR